MKIDGHRAVVTGGGPGPGETGGTARIVMNIAGIGTARPAGAASSA